MQSSESWSDGRTAPRVQSVGPICAHLMVYLKSRAPISIQSGSTARMTLGMACACVVDTIGLSTRGGCLCQTTTLYWCALTYYQLTRITASSVSTQVRRYSCHQMNGSLPILCSCRRIGR